MPAKLVTASGIAAVAVLSFVGVLTGGVIEVALVCALLGAFLITPTSSVRYAHGRRGIPVGVGLTVLLFTVYLLTSFAPYGLGIDGLRADHYQRYDPDGHNGFFMVEVGWIFYFLPMILLGLLLSFVGLASRSLIRQRTASSPM